MCSTSAAVEQGDVQAKDFFELRALSTKTSVKKRQVAVGGELVDFMMPSEDLPEDVRRAVKSLVAMGRLLGDRLGLQGRHIPQRMAVLPNAR